MAYLLQTVWDAGGNGRIQACCDDPWLEGALQRVVLTVWRLLLTSSSSRFPRASTGSLVRLAGCLSTDVHVEGVFA